MPSSPPSAKARLLRQLLETNYVNRVMQEIINHENHMRTIATLFRNINNELNSLPLIAPGYYSPDFKSEIDRVYGNFNEYVALGREAGEKSVSLTTEFSSLVRINLDVSALLDRLHNAQEEIYLAYKTSEVLRSSIYVG